MSADAAPSTSQTSERKRKRREKDAATGSKKPRRTIEEDGGQSTQSRDFAQPSVDAVEAAYSRIDHTRLSHASQPPKRKSNRASRPLSDDTFCNTPFQLRTSSLYLPLSPIAQGLPLESLCAEHLSPLILTYFEPLRGIVVSYNNPRLSSGPNHASLTGAEVLGEVIDEYAATYTWMTADFLVLRPERGVELEGQVTIQSESHIGLICWNLFNATIPSTGLPKDWQWMGPARRRKKGSAEPSGTTATGYYTDAAGGKVEGLLKFRVVDLENLPTFGRDRSFISIHGTLRDSAEVEEENAEQ